MLTTHCTYLCCQIMICMEITKIHQWQILSSLDHSSLIVHCSYTPKFLMLFQLKDSFLSNCYLLGSIIFNQHDDRLLLHSQSPPKKKFRKQLSVKLSRGLSVIQQVNTSFNCCAFLGEHSPGYWNVCLDRIGYMYMTHYQDQAISKGDNTH